MVDSGEAAADGATYTLIRHVMGGHTLDVNFWRLERGAGVNLNAPTTVGRESTSWVVIFPDGTEKKPSQPPHQAHVEERKRARTIADIPAGAEFYIKPAANPKRCLSVRSDGYTTDPSEVYLCDVDPSSKKQKWRLVDGDTFQNVESGEFLHSSTKYAMLTVIDDHRGDHHLVKNEVSEGNRTDLVTRPQDFSDAQRWVLGPEEFFGEET